MQLTRAQVEKAKLSPLDLAEVVSDQQGGWYRRAPYLELINDYLMRAARREIKRLAIFIPPQHGKSTLVSRFLPAWWVGTFPDEEVMLTSYGQDWADHWGRETRDTVEEYGQTVFGTTVADDSSARGRWQIEGHRGGFKAAGIAGSVTGRPANLLIMDDPVKNSEEAFSATIASRNIQWWASTASTRLHEDSVAVLMMTRWHPNDLAGFLLGEEGWTVLSLPAIAEHDDPMGRQPGEALAPNLRSLEFLNGKKAEQQRILNGYFWNAMYQQKPALPEGLLFFDKATCDYGRENAPEPRERKDTAPMPGATADGYVLVWERARAGERYYIGADTADGKGETLGTWSEVGGPDRNCAAVYRAKDDVQVAEIYGRQEEASFAKLLDQWGRYYNQAYIAVETNRRPVIVMLQQQLQYPNLYYTEKASDLHVAAVINTPRAYEWGWNTNPKTRPILMAEFREAITTGAIKPQSKALWDECLSFMQGDPPSAAPGQHDDRILAHAIAWQAKKRMGRSQAQQRNGGITHMGTSITLGGGR